MKICYIAGPYRSKTLNGVWENIMFARQYAIKYWNLGYSVICPHTNTMLMDMENTDNMFLEGDLEMIRRCDVMVMIPGWEKSVGACGELRLAKELGLEIIYELPLDKP